MSVANKIDDSLSVFIEECNEILERLTVGALELEKGGHEEELLQALYRDIHTMKGSAALFGFRSLSRLAHSMESRFELLRNGKLVLGPIETDLMFQCVDAIIQILKSIQDGTNEDFSLLVEQLEQKLGAA